MQSVRSIFVFSTVLLVPFLYYATSVPNACAEPSEGYRLGIGDCSGKETDRSGKTCCWTAYEGPDKGKKVCQTCYTKTGTDGSYMQSCSPVKPAAFKSTLPGLETQDRLPGGGVFEMPDNATVSQNISKSNDSSTLTELQSDVEDEAEEQSTEESDAEEEQDENEENGNSNEGE